MSDYVDAGWVACSNARRSITGYIVKLGNTLIIWKSKKQTIVSRSSTEAERSIASTVAELVWLISLMKELDIDITFLLMCTMITRLLYK